MGAEKAEERGVSSMTSGSQIQKGQWGQWKAAWLGRGWLPKCEAIRARQHTRLVLEEAKTIVFLLPRFLICPTSRTTGHLKDKPLFSLFKLLSLCIHF